MTEFTVALADPTFRRVAKWLTAYVAGHTLVIWVVRRKGTRLGTYSIMAVAHAVGWVFFFAAMATIPVVGGG